LLWKDFAGSNNDEHHTNARAEVRVCVCVLGRWALSLSDTSAKQVEQGIRGLAATIFQCEEVKAKAAAQLRRKLAPESTELVSMCETGPEGRGPGEGEREGEEAASVSASTSGEFGW
jgi:hypothetical protein